MNKGINKRIFILMILVFSFSILSGLSNTSCAEEMFDIKVELGFDGYVVPDEITPVRIELKNNFKDIEGKVQLLVANDFRQETLYTAYSKKINIAKGATKVISMESAFRKNGDLVVRVLDKKDNIVFEKIAKYLRVKRRDDLVMGVFSDSFDSIRYLSNTYSKIYDGKSSRNSHFQIVELDETIPESHRALNIFNTIVINNYNSEMLSKKQQEALKKRVEEGALLLIGTGPNYNKTLKGLDLANFLDVHGTKEVKVPKLGSEEPIKLIDGDLTQGDKIIIDGKEEMPFYHKQIGQGHVIIAAFDLGLAPFSNWDNNDEFMNKVINKYSNSNTTIDYLSPNFKRNYHRYNNIVSYLPYNLLPSPKSILIILILFILLVGPINYIILKKLDKRVLLWLTVPLVVVLFSVSIYILGFRTRLKQPILNNVSIINVKGEANTASITTKAGIMGFKNGKLDVAFNSSNGILIDDEEDYDVLRKFVEGEIVTEHFFDKENHIIFNKAGALDVRTVTINSEIELRDKIECEAVMRDGKLIGSVNNLSDLDLEDMVIFYGSRYEKLGDLKKGEKSKEFEVGMTSTISKSSRNWHSLLENLYGQYRGQRTKDMKNILNNNVKREILDDFFNRNNSLIHGNRAFIIGWNRHDVVKDIKINGKKPKGINRNLVFLPLNLKYEKGEKVTLPYGMLYSQVVDIHNMRFEHFDSMIHGDGHVVLSFKPQENIELTLMKIDFDKADIKTKNSDKIYYIYDFIQNTWEAIDKKNVTIDASNKNKYYDESKGTLIKIDPDQDIHMMIPSFEVEGVIK